MRRRNSIAGSPVLVGAATVLVVVVAVFLAYNANNGLPFVPSYTLKVHVRDAAALVKGNDVRIAGTRVGAISEIAPQQNPRTGRVSAVLTLKLEKRVEPLPLDTTVIVRARSALGLKYLELKEGHSTKGYPDGATVPLTQATPQPVEIDDVFNTFNEPTRKASQTNIDTFSDAFAGRGGDLNETFAVLPHLLSTLTPVMNQLADKRTGFGELFDALEQTAGAIAPVAEQQAGWFVGMDATFSAFASVARPYLQDAISEGPATLTVATNSFRHQAPFIEKTTRFFNELQPATAALATASGPLGEATATGATTLTQAVALNNRLDDVLDAFAKFGTDQQALAGIADLTATAKAAQPLVNVLAPMQTVCNYPALLFRNLASALADGDNVGTWLIINPILTTQGPNNEGGPSSTPANGPTLENHLHSNPYPNVAAPGQTKECEAGNEFYQPGLTFIGNLPGNQGTQHDTDTTVLTKEPTR